MSCGVHVGRSIKPTLHENIEFARARFACQAVQIFTHGPHNGHQAEYCLAELRRLRGEGMRIYVHAAYVTPWGKSHFARVQLAAADEFGASALVLHLPNKPPTEVAQYAAYLSRMGYRTPLALEMRAMHPGPGTYETPDKINALAAALHQLRVGPSAVMICLDTAHIYAGGAQIRTASEAQAFIKALTPLTVSYMRLLHLNGNQYDARVRAGDKHAAPHGALDFIWGPLCGPLEWSDSGCRILAEWYLNRGCDIILEQSLDDSETLAIQKNMRKGITS